MARRPDTDDFQKIFDLMEEGSSLRQACAKLGVDRRQASVRIKENETLRHQYAQAREALGELDAENVLTMAKACAAGQISPDRARVAIDAFKWAAGQRAPKQWGTQRTELSGSVTINADEEANKLAAAIKSLADDV